MDKLKQFDLDDYTKAVRFYFLDANMKGLAFAVVDGKDNRYVTSVVGNQHNKMHFFIHLDYILTQLGVYYAMNENSSQMSDNEKKAFNDLCLLAEYLLKVNQISVKKEIETSHD